MDTCACTHTGKAAGYWEKKMSLTCPENIQESNTWERAQDQGGGWWVYSVDIGGNCSWQSQWIWTGKEKKAKDGSQRTIIFKRQEEQARSMRDTQRNESRTKKQPVSEVKGGKSLKKEVASSSKCSWEVMKIRHKEDWFPNDNCFKVMNSFPSKGCFHWHLYSKNLKCCVSCKKTIYNHCNSRTVILWTDFYFRWWDSSVQFSSVAQSCPTLCDPMNRSTPGLPVHHQLPEFTQTHVHRVGDAIQPFHPLSSPSPPAPNPSQHQSLFQWVDDEISPVQIPFPFPHAIWPLIDIHRWNKLFWKCSRPPWQ